MGRAEEEEPDLASEVHELLSVNSEDDEDPAPAQLEPPEKTASPNVVRKYIVSLLQRRDVDLKQATKIAAQWRLGTGEELREYTRDMYIGIFGAEDGWVIHKDVQSNLEPEVARLAAEKRKDDYALHYSMRWISRESRLMSSWCCFHFSLICNQSLASLGASPYLAAE